MRETVPFHIEEIITAAAAAPSGDNSQPWHFVFRKPDTIEFHYHPERDNPILNVDDSGTLIALGAAIENASLEAGSQGYSSAVTIQSKAGKPLVATMRLTPGGSLSSQDAELHSVIFTRHSNRKAYANTSLEPTMRKVFLEHEKEFPELSVVLLEDRKKMELFARNLTVMEEVALMNKTLHALFFANIFWSNKKQEKGEPGLHGKTLELPPPAQALFRVLRYWPIASVLAHAGFPRFVAETNAKQNASSAAFGAILSPALTIEIYISTGRLLERIWLLATSVGLSFQIVSGILFLARRVELGENTSALSIAEQKVVRDADASIRQILGTKDKHPVITFRIGYGKPATLRSARMKPQIEVI